MTMPADPMRRALFAGAVRTLVEVSVIASNGNSGGAVLLLAEAIRSIGMNGDLSGDKNGPPRCVVEAIVAVGRELKPESMQ